MPSSTSSVRMPDELRQRLERTAERIKKGKNWIINQALDEYLLKLDRDALTGEARRQSLLAKSSEEGESAFWDSAADTRGWR